MSNSCGSEQELLSARESEQGTASPAPAQRAVQCRSSDTTNATIAESGPTDRGMTTAREIPALLLLPPSSSCKLLQVSLASNALTEKQNAVADTLSTLTVLPGVSPALVSAVWLVISLRMLMVLALCAIQ